MGDHFVLLVDRLITESTLEAAIENRSRSVLAATTEIDPGKDDESLPKGDLGRLSSSSGKLVECRICQEEDEDSNMETPCSCSGSLKYAHRRCVQRWCNVKGDTTCEICHQHYKPGYTAPPPLFHFGQIPLNFRGNWEISRSDLTTPHIIAMVSTNRNFPNPGFEESSVSNARSMICYRLIALIFMVLLVFRHTLPVLFSETTEYSFPLLTLLLLQATVVVLPIFVIVKTVAASQQGRHEQMNSMFGSWNEETEVSTMHLQPHVIHVQ